MDRDHQNSGAGGLHAVPAVSGLCREGLAQSTLGVYEGCSEAEQEASDGLGEVRTESRSQGAEETGGEGGVVSTGSSRGEVSREYWAEFSLAVYIIYVSVSLKCFPLSVPHRQLH